jgi:hypothetical protein
MPWRNPYAMNADSNIAPGIPIQAGRFIARS